nr:MAG TPA: hypothetical protein [Caudoviricetes sp.]DAY69706.1 MAG TPA: hypothetical protein [Caudoviricetes sp.]
MTEQTFTRSLTEEFLYSKKVLRPGRAVLSIMKKARAFQ